MSNEVELLATGELTHLKLSGKLTKESYESFVPAVEKQIQKHGKLRLLVEMHDFHGWTAGALWEDIKFDTHHWRDIERLAIVGETKFANRSPPQKSNILTTAIWTRQKPGSPPTDGRFSL